VSVAASTIHREMTDFADPARAAAVSRFFKTAPGQYGAGDHFLGIAVPVLRKLAVKYQAVPRRTVIRLLESRWHEGSTRLKHCKRPMSSPQTAAAMKDAERFLDMEKTYALVVKETTVIGQ
jgi:hypothetical protein